MISIKWNHRGDRGNGAIARERERGQGHSPPPDATRQLDRTST
jgi:hypothetical protein